MSSQEKRRKLPNEILKPTEKIEWERKTSNMYRLEIKNDLTFEF
jgi:hypothetical protein